jgi:hypothetical protein
MKQITMTVVLEFDEEMMCDWDEEAQREWFFEAVLDPETLVLHSNEIGDEVGRIVSVDIKKDNL